MPKYLRRTLKIFLWLFGILIVLLIGAYFFIQTQTFNKLALEYTVSKLNKSWELKESKLNVASIHGNILKGIRADYGSIVVKEDTLLDFSYLDVKYDIWGLFNHEIRVEHATLNSPRINLIKLKYNKDSLIWNFMNLFASAEEKDTSVSEFDWDLTLEKLRIENGHFKVAGNLDENNPEWKYGSSKQDTFDFNNLDITNFEMELDARYFKNFKNISIKNLSFNTNSDFNLRKFVLDGNINMKDTVSDLWGIEMVTDRSKIKIDKIHMEEFSPFNKIVYDNWGNKDFEVKLNIEKFNFADLKFFLPELDFLDSTAGLILNVDGKYGDLNIHELSLKLPNSEISLKGKLVNLQDPENLYIDARIDSLKLYPHDALTVIKIPSVPDYSNLGMIYGNIYYKGRIDNFYSEYDLRTGAGNIRGVTNLDINYESFNGYVTTAGLNLGKVLKSRELNSNLNLSAKFSGNGFGPGRIANINYSMAGSSISGYHINRSSGNIQARGNSLTINTNTSTSAGSATVSGRINIANTNNPSYVLKGRVTGLDVSKITKNPEDQSSLNMSFDVSGRGTNLNNINGKYNFVVSQSTYGGHQLPETPLNIEINAGGDQSSVVLASEMADFNAKGRFDIGSAVNTVQYNISSFIDAVLGRINSQGTDIRVTNTTNVVSKDMNLDFELVVKDTAKLNETLQPFGISFNGDIKGNMVNSPNGFKTEMIVNVNDFKYKDTSIIIKNFNSGLTFENTYRYVSANSLSPYKIVLNSNAEKIKIGSNNIDSAKVGFNMANASAVLLARGIQDSLTYGKINANFDLTGANVEAKVDSIYIHYHKYEIANNNTWLIDYLPGTEVNFKEVGIRSKNAVVNLNGNYVFDGNSDIKIEGNNMNVVDIYDILSPPDTTIIIGKRHKYPVSGNISQLYFNFKGTTDKPELDLKMTTDVLKYRQDNIGTISADVNYKDEVLTPNIVFQNTNNGGSLKLTGEIPYQNPLIAHDTVIELYYNPVSLRLKADNFQMNNFSKLYPGIGDLRGVLKGNITAAGTVSNPELRGALVVNNGQYYLDLTGMNYNFDFDMTTENSKLVVEKLTIYHTNDRARHFDLTGDIDFAGMKINDINLTGGGSLVLLDETADENQLQVEGYLYGGSGSQPLVIKGNLNKLDVTGQFLIKDAKISSIPLKGSGYNPGEDNFVYISRLPDTLTRYRDSSITVSKEDFEKISPFERYKYRVSQNPSSLMDILNLDVNVKTEKNINVAIDFKNITRDRLYGELTGSMDIKTQDKQINAYGNVEMVGNSYYRFYKDFKLNESKIIFNGQINDPYLDIRAVYNGTKVTEQHGNTANTPVQIVMTLKGSIDKPEITLRLLEDGTEVTGSDAQADAVTFLLFGKYKSELSTSERTAVASSVGTSVGSLYISSFVSQAVTEVLPFVVDAEFIYSPDQTGLQLTSELGEGTITLGGKQVKDVRYFEFNIQYPLNKMIGLNLPETLLLEISKKEVSNSFTTQSTDVKFSTGLKLIYKFKF